jgi:hypothetical protein
MTRLLAAAVIGMGLVAAGPASAVKRSTMVGAGAGAAVGAVAAGPVGAVAGGAAGAYAGSRYPWRRHAVRHPHHHYRH